MTFVYGAPQRNGSWSKQGEDQKPSGGRQVKGAGRITFDAHLLPGACKKKEKKKNTDFALFLFYFQFILFLMEPDI